MKAPNSAPCVYPGGHQGNAPGDRAGKSHWDETWNAQEAPTIRQVDGPGRWNHVNRETARLLRRWLQREPAHSARLVEFGCARSIWLPYFAKQLGYQVIGVDYSERGCELARETLAIAGVTGSIVLGDFFDPPPGMVGQFDAAFSYGVAEHFDETSKCISAFARFLNARGRLVTIIPNMTGVPGFLQKHLNRPVFDKHVPLDREGLVSAHQQAGLDVLDSGYLANTNFGVMNLTGVPPGTIEWAAKRVLLAALARISLATWIASPILPPVQKWAGYVYCVAERA